VFLLTETKAVCYCTSQQAAQRPAGRGAGPIPNPKETKMADPTAKRHMSTRDIILAGILLAAGAVLRAFFPKLPVTPNFIIAMYCLVILLVRPRLLEALAIGVVSAILSQLTSGSPVPGLNFLSEPLGCLAGFLLARPRYRLAIANYSLKPAVVTFLSTLVSGCTFVTVLSLVLMSGGKGEKFIMIATVVVPTALANTAITQLCYAPLRRVLRIADPDAPAPAKAAA
jgi:hypothetical protein